MRRDGAKMELIWGKCEAEYFRCAIWTTQITLNWLVKFVLWRSAFHGLGLAGRAVAHPKRLLICPSGDRQERCLQWEAEQQHFRGRDASYLAPPAQIRTGPIRAYGSHLGCLTAKRLAGHG